MSEYLGVAALALVAGMVGAMLVDWRFWRYFVLEVYHHGPDNHRCQRVGCCR